MMFGKKYENYSSSLCVHRLHETIQRRIPCVTLTGLCPVDCALELYFAVPEELSQFVPPLSAEAGLAAPERSDGGDVAGSSIANPNSEVEIPTDSTVQPFNGSTTSEVSASPVPRLADSPPYPGPDSTVQPFNGSTTSAAPSASNGTKLKNGENLHFPEVVP